jgi:Peptidase family M23
MRRGRALLAALGAIPVAVSVTAGSASSGTDKPGISPTTLFTPLASQVLTTPQAVKMSDGKYHLAYELLLTNATDVDVDVQSVAVRDASNGHVVMSLTGTALSAEMNPIGNATPSETSTTMSSSSISIVWLDVTFPTKDDIPQKLDHRVAGTVLTPAGRRPFDAIVSPLTVNTAEPIVLAPPVLPGTWLMSEGCCRDLTHHRRGLAPINGTLLVPQRFAIDLFLLDQQHRTWIGDPKDAHSYLSYGQPALAAADGVVVAAFDGLPDQHPPEPPPIPPIADTVGNHVIIKTGSDVYLLYAHMKPGTIAVQVGQQVKSGQQIGSIGTTGNSTTPHLHFQVITTPTFFPADSTPYVFERFELVGHETERIWDDNVGLQPDGTIPFEPAANSGPRQNVLPLDRDIVKF